MIELPYVVYLIIVFIISMKVGEILIEYWEDKVERDKYPYTGDTIRLDKSNHDKS